VGLSFILALAVGQYLGLRAQQVQGSFTGTVRDQSGAIIPGVSVTALQVDTGASRSTLTSEDGSYMIPLLLPRRYRLTAEKKGFDTTIQGPINLLVDAHSRVDFKMNVGAQTTTVTVESAPPVLDTQAATVGTTVEQAKISQLPYNGRNFLQTLLFTPGVVPGVQGSELNNNPGGSINVNGLREDMNSFLLDGMSNTTIAIGAYVAAPPLDSIQEFKIETGVYDARFGVSGGAQVNIVTKSGTNQLHGSLYEYLRNNNFDARNFFEPNVPPFHRNQYGASLGGPIVIPHVYIGHDKTFFFLNYEGLRDNHSFFSRAHVPTLAELGGDFSDIAPGAPCSHTSVLLDPLLLVNPAAPLTIPGNNLNNIAPVLPAGTLDPVGRALAGLYPSPNIPNAPCGGENYQQQVLRIIDTNSFVGRFDHRWGSKDSFFYRYSLTTESSLTPSGLPTGVPGFGTRRVDWFDQTGLDWTHVFAPTVLNEAKVGYNRWQYLWNNEDQGRNINQVLGLKGAPTAYRDTGVPNLTFAGYDDMGAYWEAPQSGAVNSFQFADTVTYIHGNHSFDFGTDIRPIKRGNFYEDIDARDAYNFNGVATGSAVFAGLPSSVQTALLAACAPPTCSFGNGVADALFGLPTSWIRGSSGYISGTGTEYDFFAQDRWKARPNLTVTLGLRYEYNSLITDKYNHFGSFDFNKGLLLAAGTSAASLLNFVGTTGATGLPIGQFKQVGTENLGSTSENRALQLPDHTDFGPRLGIAWRPFGNEKTVIRTGGGVYYDQMVGQLYFQKSFNPPYFQLSQGNLLDNEQAVFTALAMPPSAGGLPLATGLLLQNLFVAPSLTQALYPALDPVNLHVKEARIYEWTFDVQRQLGSWLLDVGYVGTQGLRLPFEWDPNQPNNALYTGGGTCIPNTPANTPCPRPFRNFQTMSYTDPIGTSIYHSLQVKVEKHYTNGLAIIGAYTWSKSLDDDSAYFGTNASPGFPENSYNLAAEKGRSDFDYEHRFSLAYVYDLPFGNKIARLQNSKANYLINGWEVAGIAMLQSGAPYTPTVDGNPSNNIDNHDRPNVVRGVSLYPAHKSVNQWANPAAFSMPAQYTFGNAGRNILTGPGLADWDFSLIRNLKLWESKTLQFRVEMFNIFNRPNFTLPNADWSSTSFGVIGNTVQPIAGQASGGPGDPREIQFALPLTW
jgi:outer membrane receptor protein involved in Fe transport